MVYSVPYMVASLGFLPPRSIEGQLKYSSTMCINGRGDIEYLPSLSSICKQIVNDNLHGQLFGF